MDIKYAGIGNVEDRVVEECSELLQAICKANRFGLFSYHPGTKVLNIDQIRNEVIDVFRVCDELSQLLDRLENENEPII